MMNQKNMKMSYFKQGFALRYVIYLVLLLWVKNSVGLVERWENIETIKPFSLFSVHATSTNDVFAATYDNAEGSFIYYSYNAGASWEKVPTKGNNYAMAMSGNGKTLCAAGTKAYCANATQTLGWDVFELNFHSSGHDVRSVEQEGFAMVGSFGLNDEVFNGVAYLKNFDYAWSLYDIQLDRKEGYYALQGSFPSENMWYVVSGSWPKQNEIIASILSGRLVMVPTGKYFFGYQYEYLTLPPASANQKYAGAISKTTDGGKTWQKIFDSNNEYFINQIDCIDGGEACIAVGEGPEKAVVLKTIDGGANWNIALTLNSTYSLHACEMLSATTYWVGGGMVAPFPSDDTTAHLRVGGGSGNEVTNFIGVYYKTINGGDDWSMFTGQGYVYDFTFFNEKVGYAATIFRDRCGIAKLKLV